MPGPLECDGHTDGSLPRSCTCPACLLPAACCPLAHPYPQHCPTRFCLVASGFGVSASVGGGGISGTGRWVGGWVCLAGCLFVFTSVCVYLFICFVLLITNVVVFYIVICVIMIVNILIGVVNLIIVVIIIVFIIIAVSCISIIVVALVIAIISIIISNMFIIIIVTSLFLLLTLFILRLHLLSHLH